MVTLSVIISSIIFPEHIPKTVNEAELKNYVEAYLKKYKEIVEENLHLVHNIKHVFFKYNNNPKKVLGLISRSHGAAVILKYETPGIYRTTYWEIKVIDEPIEYHFWPNMSTNLDTLNIIRIVGNKVYILNSQISIKNFALLIVNKETTLYYIGEEESPFQIEGPGAVKIFGEVASRSGLILKGVNSKQAWSTYQAGLDALKHFLLDCKSQLNETIIKQIEIKHKKPLLLEKIYDNIKSKYYKEHPEAFYKDLDELEKLGISEELKILLWNKYEELMREPTLWEKIVDSLQKATFQIITSIIAGTISGVLVILLTPKKRITKS